MTTKAAVKKVNINTHYEACFTALESEIEEIMCKIRDRSCYDYGKSSGERDEHGNEIGTGGSLVEQKHEIGMQIKDLNAEIADLDCEIEKRQKVITSLKEQGMDAKSVEAELGELTKKRNKLPGSLEKTNQSLSDLLKIIKGLWDESRALKDQQKAVTKQLEASRFLAHIGITNAFLVPNPEAVACHESVRSRLIWNAHLDELGALDKVEFSFSLSRDTDSDGLVWIARNSDSIAFSITGTERRFIRGIVPEALHWIAACTTREGLVYEETVSYADPVEDENLVFICVDANQLIISDCLKKQFPEYELETKVHFSDYDRRWRAEKTTTGIDCLHELMDLNRLLLLSDVLHSALKASCEQAKQVIQLDQDYDEGSLLSILQQRLIDATTTVSNFAISDLELTSQETFARIKDDWQRFKNAPWSWDIMGTAASLKHLVENGERVRFWCNAHENHYGFRVRTRDHSWIVGNIFIDDQYEGDSTVIEVCAKKPLYARQAAVSFLRIGRMCLEAWETKN